MRLFALLMCAPVAAFADRYGVNEARDGGGADLSFGEIVIVLVAFAVVYIGLIWVIEKMKG